MVECWSWTSLDGIFHVGVVFDALVKLEETVRAVVPKDHLGDVAVKNLNARV